MNTRRKTRRARTHGILLIVLTCIFGVCLVGAVAVGSVLSVASAWTEDLPSVVETDAFNYSEKSTVYAADGKTVLAEFRLENREPVNNLSDISQDLINATVATEDSRFYEHNGVDPLGILRAIIGNLTGGTFSGASTITQQLVRNTILADEMNVISLERKVREAELALEMEKHYSKDQILLMYLNTINYGEAYGIEAAALRYFSKHANELTLVEAATLAGIPQSPSNWNPIVNPEGCLNRRNIVLSRMLSQGYIDSNQYTEAVQTELKLNVKEKEGDHGIYLYPYFTSYVRTWLLEEYTTSEIFTGGMKIYTTLDVDKQEAAEEVCAEQVSDMQDGLEAALVAIDPKNGHVQAMVGGKDWNSSQFNIAAQGGRPFGSAFKMFTLTAAIEQGVDPSTRVYCGSEYKLKSGRGTVENFGGINYGTRSLQSATAVSSNTAFVKLQEFIGGESIIEMAGRLGLDTSDLYNVDTLTLGVCDVTCLEMASAYATLAAGGIHYDPVVVSKILDRKGEVIYEDKQEGKRVLDESVVGAVTDVLRTVFTQSDGTAYGYGIADGRPVAGKTGTTSDFHDHTLVGYTPDLAAACWIGDRYASITSENLSCNWMFSAFMSEALSGTPVSYFPDYTAPKYNKKWDAGGDEEADDTTGMTKDAALAALDDYDVSISEEYSDTVPAGVVISQSNNGNSVSLVISKGPDPNKKPEEEKPNPSPNPGEGGETPQPSPGGEEQPGSGGGNDSA